MPDQMTPAAFSAAIKAKHPEYKDVADDVLVKAMLDKFPQYKDQIQTGPAPPSINDLRRGVVLNEDGTKKYDGPDTFMGGFLKSIKDQMLGDTSVSGKDGSIHTSNSMLEGAAHPQTIGDFLSLVVPSEGTWASPMATESDRAGWAAAKASKPGVLNRLKNYAEGAYKNLFPDKLPELSQPPALSSAVTIATPKVDTIDRALAEARGGRVLPKGTPTEGAVPPPTPAGPTVAQSVFDQASQTGQRAPITDDMVKQSLGERAAPAAAGDPQALRESVGSEDAAKKLGISVDDLKAKTAQGPYGLPADARARIDAALEALTAQGRTPAELDQYIAQASPLARLYITAKLGQ